MHYLVVALSQLILVPLFLLVFFRQGLREADVYDLVPISIYASVSSAGACSRVGVELGFTALILMLVVSLAASFIGACLSHAIVKRKSKRDNLH